MFRSDKYKFYFVHIPKTGGTSIKAALNKFANPGLVYFHGELVVDGNGFHPHVPYKPTMKRYESYFKFAFVRNPWSRLASLYRFLKGRGSKDVAGLDFHQFIHKICTTGHMYSRTQMEYGLKHMDFIGKFENLEEDFKHVCGRIGIPEQPLKHYKNQGYYDYRNMYNFSSRKLVRVHFTNDIEQFEYTF